MSDEKYPKLDYENYDSGELYDFLKETLIGRRLIHFGESYIKLDNGYEISIYPNDGRGSCPNGRAEISASDANTPMDAAVMNLEYEEIWSDEYPGNVGFKIFILMKNEKISLEGSDASETEPYYGSGFWLNASLPVHREQE